MPPTAMNWQGNFNERGLGYRTFAKMESPNWMTGIGAGPQDFASHSGVCGIGNGNAMMLPSHSNATTTEIGK